MSNTNILRLLLLLAGDSLIPTLQPSTANNSGLLLASASGNTSYSSSSKSRGFDEVKGCPEKIPILQNGKVLAGAVWIDKGNDISQLACNGDSDYWYAETLYTVIDVNFLYGIGSMIINPGCTLYVFPEFNYGGKAGTFGAGLYPNTPIEKGFYNCNGGACFKSVLWTCKQTYPACTPTDGWEIIATLDNLGSPVSTDFTYEKAVGTSFSSSMKDSMSVSTEVKASISAKFWGITASMGLSHTTKHDWANTDSSTKSEHHTYTVSVKVPPKIKVQVQNAVGTCGDSKIHTQLFRVVEPANSRTGEKIVAQYHGKMTSYVLPGKHVEDHVGHDTATCLNGNGADYSGTTNKTISGRTCQNWSSQSPNEHGFGALGNHNYCRNPNNRDGVWCYTEDTCQQWEYCFVPICG